MARSKPEGYITRGTTHPNRLRRVDRFICGPLAGALRTVPAPVVVDLGYGAATLTPLEMHARISAAVPGVRLVGVEIDPQRVEEAQSRQTDTIKFVRGGFEVPLPTGWPDPVLIRAFNVLRQYDESEVPRAWARMLARLHPSGFLIDGTCDEPGRLASWITLDASGPRWFTISIKTDALERPRAVAARLPKALIHHNLPGEQIHALLSALDDQWFRAAPLSTFGARQRWLAAISQVKQAGWPVLHGPERWRLGEVTVPWGSVAPQ